MRMNRLRFALVFLLVASGIRSTASPWGAGDNPPPPPKPRFSSGVTVTPAPFYGWKAIILRNRAAEVIVVPAIGRVMQFNLLDDKGNAIPGPFWNNPEIGGQLHADSEGWTNYGGDKAWPAPQSEWPKVAGRAWPPPQGFDAVSFTASIDGSRVELLSPVDPSYGVRVHRTIALDPERPVMTIETSYQKVQGRPVRVGIWTITQLASPDRAFILLPTHSALAAGYTNLLPSLPKDLTIDGRLLSLARDPVNKTMIGSDGSALLWVGNGPSPDLLVETEPKTESKTKTVSVAGHNAEWPEQGSHSKIYTNSGEELKYVEFELLAQLRDLSRGETASATSVYRLIPRTESDPLAEAKKAFERP
jgi:hypothetical protein